MGLAFGQKKTARHLCSGGLSVSLVTRLAVPLRQRAREVEKIAEEPERHGAIQARTLAVRQIPHSEQVNSGCRPDVQAVMAPGIDTTGTLRSALPSARFAASRV